MSKSVSFVPNERLAYKLVDLIEWEVEKNLANKCSSLCKPAKAGFSREFCGTYISMKSVLHYTTHFK